MLISEALLQTLRDYRTPSGSVPHLRSHYQHRSATSYQFPRSHSRDLARWSARSACNLGLDHDTTGSLRWVDGDLSDQPTHLELRPACLQFHQDGW